jgi:hypothetical protein
VSSADDRPLEADQAIEQRRLADVGPADDRHRDRRLAVVGRRLGRLAQVRQHVLQQGVDADPVLGRDRVERLDAERIEFADQVVLLRGVDLVHRQQHRLLELAQPLDQLLVQRIEAGAAVDHRDHDVGLLGGDQRLDAHRPPQLLVLLGLEAAGVDDQEAAVAPAADGDVAVARHARRRRHQRPPRVGEAIEQRRLAGVRPPDEGDDRQRLQHLGPRQRGISVAGRGTRMGAGGRHVAYGLWHMARGRAGVGK